MGVFCFVFEFWERAISWRNYKSNSKTLKFLRIIMSVCAYEFLVILHTYT